MDNNNARDWEPDPEMVEQAQAYQQDVDPAEQAEREREQQEAYEADMQQRHIDYLQEREELERRAPYLPANTLPGLFAKPAPPIRAYVDKLIYAGAITILAGDPKAGKTTLMLHVLNSLTNGNRFLWSKCDKTTILYASEQSEVSFKEQVRKVPGLKDSKSFRVILFEDNRVEKEFTEGDNRVKREVSPATWDEQIELWNQAIKKNHAKVLVIDTFTAFSNFKLGEAFDAGVVQGRLQTLKRLLTETPELAIMILHHLRKETSHSGGNRKARRFSDIANSYAFRAGSDQNILLCQYGDNLNARTLRIEGRFSEETELIIVLRDGNFQLVQEAAVKSAKQIIDEAVKKDSSLNKLSLRELAERLHVPYNQVQQYRKNVGKKGD